jgi:23S rRNA pseudouridine1911/1915/1917 synthase
VNIDIVYEDNDILAINKPAGLVVHADGRTKEQTVTDWILEKYPDVKGIGEPLTLSNGTIIDRPGIVHRIDRDTSGVLLIAKNQNAFLYLKSQFQNREVEKKYNAFVYGEIKDQEGLQGGIIDRPIARSKKDFRLWSAQRGSRGEARDAITEYEILLKTNISREKGYTYIEARPKTGRTHQIRVHLKAINHPVICDTLYAPKREPALGFSRLALHARSIIFSNLKGEKVTAEAPLPPDFTAALEQIKKITPPNSPFN